MMEQGVDQRSGPVARGGMNHHAGGLVDDDQMIVLEQDIQRDMPRAGGSVFRLGNDQNPFIAAFEVWFWPSRRPCRSASPRLR